MAEAHAAGADAFFDEKYGERSARSVSATSPTSCAAARTAAVRGQIGNFVITGERSIGSGDAPHRGGHR